MKALLLLGCPEVAVQTGLALYVAHKLKSEGIKTVGVGTASTLGLMAVADPQHAYIDSLINLDRCIDLLADHKAHADIVFGFIHKDSGIQYLASVAAMTDITPVAIVFGRDAEDLSSEVERSIHCKILWAKAVHNPIELKKKIDEVGLWAAVLKK